MTQIFFKAILWILAHALPLLHIPPELHHQHMPVPGHPGHFHHHPAMAHAHLQSAGLPPYMAPEVMTSHTYDSRADIWSLGIIIFQCLTGKAPFHAQTPQKLRALYEHSKTLEPVIPDTASASLRNLLTLMLKRNPKERLTFLNFFQHPFLSEERASLFDATCRIPSPGKCCVFGFVVKIICFNSKISFTFSRSPQRTK